MKERITGLVKNTAVRGVVLVAMAPAAIGGMIKEEVIDDSSIFDSIKPGQEYALKAGFTLIGTGFWLHSVGTRNRQMEGAEDADKNLSSVGLDLQGLGIAARK